MPADEAKPVTGDKLLQVITLACEKQSRMKMTTTVSAMPFYSRILRMVDNELVISALDPPLLDEEMLIDATMEIAFPLNSRGYFIGKCVFRGVTSSGPGRYIITVPRQMAYVRHRRTERVTPPPSLPVSVLAIEGEKTGDSVVVQDISLEGIGLIFVRDMRSLEIGHVLHQVKLKLAGSKYLTLDGAVRHVLIDEEGRTHVGLMWEPIGKNNYLTLQNYIQLVQEHNRRLESNR